MGCLQTNSYSELPKIDFTQFSRTFYKDLREFRYLRLMRASFSSTRPPMEPESRPSSEQGLASAVNLAGAFDHLRKSLCIYMGDHARTHAVS
jgi:hypothetical protein